MASLKQVAIRGTIWTIACYGLSQALRLVSNLIMARLLFPEAFGLMTLVHVFITGLNMFSDVGITPSIIQNQRGSDARFLNTAWSIQIIRGVIIWLCCLLITLPVASFYGEQQLLWLLPIVGFGSVISGFNSTAIATLNRDMAFAKLNLFNLFMQFMTTAFMIVWAWLHPSIWALAAGSLFGAFIFMASSHYLDPKIRNRWDWDRSAVKELLSFGQWIFFSTATTFLASQADRLILGRLFSLELLGIYGIAFILSEMPRSVLLALSDKVFFPLIAKLADLPRSELKSNILKHRRLLLVLAAVGIALLTSIGDWIVYLLYDERYQQAEWMLPILAVGIWPSVLSQSIDPALFAIGKPVYVAIANTMRCIFILISIPLGFYWFGIPGAVIAVALNDIPFYVGVIFGLIREKLYTPLQDFSATAFFLLCLSAALVLRASLGLGTPIDGLLN